MSIAKEPDVNGNITISSSCVKCAGGQGSSSPGRDYGSPDLTKKVEVVLCYNANRSDNGAFGFGRTLSVNLFLQMQTSSSAPGSTVTLTRGNGNEATYKSDGATGYVAQSVGLRNTLTADNTNSLWKESTPDGRVMAYPMVAPGQISRIAWAQDSVGNQHTFSYDTNGLLQSVQDAFGRKMTFAYNASNLLDSVTDFAGRVTRFAYDTTSVPGKPLLTLVTGPLGCQTKYEYDTQPRLTAVVDPNGFRTGYSYDAQGRVVQRNVAGVGSDTYSYQVDRTIWTDALGHTTTFLVDANSQLSGTISATGQRTSVIRNSRGQETQTQDASGGTWQTAYDAQGNVISTTDPLGNVTRTEYDAYGYGNPTRVTYPDGAVERMFWGSGGPDSAKRRLQAFTDALGNITSYAYNAHGQLTSTTDALGNVTKND